jgi:hypothetical protein
MEPYRKRPEVVAPFPPVGFVKKQTVTPWDNWWTLTKFLDTEDPWDLIYFNFQTYDPDEVNWYLYEKVGCRGTTHDGRNYRFDSGDPYRAVEIYLPQWDFRGPGPKQTEAQQTVLAILRGPVASAMSFNIGSVSLLPGDLLDVASAIESGKITLIHRPTLGHMAIYDSQRNRMAIPFASLPPPDGQAIVVHEAVHAVMDMRRIKLTSIPSEVIAYAAQALFLRRNGLDMANWTPSPAFSENPRNYLAWTGIFQSASAIAELIDKGQSADVWIAPLGISLKVSPTYADQGDPVNDGI